MGKKKTLKQILDPLPELLNDVTACEEYLSDGKQPSRRSYVRSLFAMIEGSIHCLKELEFAELYLKEKKYIPTLVALKGVSFEVKTNGEINETPKFVQTANNLRFMAKQFEDIFGKKLDLGVGTSKWEDFTKAISLRNRITHPKQITDFQITDDEIQLAQRVNSWFNQTIKDIIEHIAAFYKE